MKIDSQHLQFPHFRWRPAPQLGCFLEVSPPRRRAALSKVTLRSLGLSVGLVGIFSFAQTAVAEEDVTIKSSQGTFVLTAPSKLLGESALISAERAAENAMSAVSADGAALAAEEKILEKEQAVYKEKHAAAQKELDSKGAVYKQNLAAYTTRLKDYDVSLGSYKSEVAQQRSQVAASNALPPTRRDPSNVERLNNWRTRLDTQQSSLDGQKRSLDVAKAGLDTQRAAIAAFQKEKEAALALLANAVKEKANKLAFKQGEAYRQLQQCHKYALEIKKLLSTKYNVESSTTSSAAWRSAEERLKELSNRGFDGNTDKPPLTERKKDTQFFKKP